MNYSSSGPKDAEKAALAQQVQLDSLKNSLTEMSQYANALAEQSSCQSNELDDMELAMRDLFALAGVEQPSDDELKITTIRTSLMLDEQDKEQIERSVDGLDFTSKLLEASDDWDVYMQEVERYARENYIDLNRDPFDGLLTQQQKIDLKKNIDKDFDQECGCDNWDYIIAASCGTLSGFIDVFFVGIPGQSKFCNITDEVSGKLVEQFAKFSGWNGPSGDSDSTRSAIGFLERTFKVNYDQRH